MRSVLHILLVSAITLVYVVGARVTVEFEHSHDVHSHHGHQHGEENTGADHHGHPHDRGPAPSPADSEDEHGDPHQHSHMVALGMDAPFTSPAFPRIAVLSWTSIRSSLPATEPYPDGPCFPLIKPPQLG